MLPIVLGALVLALLGLAAALATASRTAVGLAFTTIPVAVLGLVVARRQPGNRIGVLLLGSSAVYAVYGDAEGYSVRDYHFDARYCRWARQWWSSPRSCGARSS